MTGRLIADQRPDDVGSFHLIHTNQPDEWMKILHKACMYDFYHTPTYHLIAEKYRGGKAELIVFQEKNKFIALPLVIHKVPEYGDDTCVNTCYDASSVYGYAGPVSSHEDLPVSFIRNFQGELESYLIKKKVVCTFSRLHPFIRQNKILDGIGTIRGLSNTVSIDLTISPEEQLSQFRTSHRQDIGYLQKKGVSGILDTNCEYLEAFIDMYNENMKRLNADMKYLHDPGYFHSLFDTEDYGIYLFISLQKDQAIGGAIVTSCNGIVQYHHGATMNDSLKLGSTKLLLNQIRIWAYEQGFQYVHLGGGYGSTEDSLYHFKAGFSDRRHRFQVWEWIVQPAVYKVICQAAAEYNRSFVEPNLRLSFIVAP